MEMVPVESSNIASIGYDLDRETLAIEFLDGSAYEYYDVPKYVHDELMSAPSHGSYLASDIKRNYSYSRI